MRNNGDYRQFFVGIASYTGAYYWDPEKIHLITSVV